MATKRAARSKETKATLTELLARLNSGIAQPHRFVDGAGAERIRALRNRMALNRQELAERFSLDRFTRHVHKATRAEPHQRAICQALGVDPDPGGIRKMVV